MFESWGRVVYRRRRLVLEIAAIAVALVAAIESVVQFSGPLGVDDGVRRTALAGYARRLGHIPGVLAAQLTAVRGQTALVDVRYSAGSYSASARAIVGQVRGIAPPPGARAYVGGQTARLVDELSSLRQVLPWMLLVVALATIAALFLAFGYGIREPAGPRLRGAGPELRQPART